MKSIFLSLIMVATLNSCLRASGPDPLQTSIEEINKKLEKSYLMGDAAVVVSFYDNSFIYLPEYRPVIDDRTILQKFFSDWFRTARINSYKKTIYSVESIGKDHVLEIGHFELRYESGGDTTIVYGGKYMTMWKKNAAGNLVILSDAFGAEKWIAPEKMPYASVKVDDPNPLEKNQLSPRLRAELLIFDEGVVKAVLGGDGEERAREFTEDGIYMPHFDPMQIGMKMLRPYMLKTYQPGIIKSVKDTYREIFDTGEFVFLSGHFNVSFDNGQSKGNFEGNMSNLMKRGKDGKLLMYRQIAHN